ncbi:dephospho-CoA kinase [Paenibacillus albiflavus]|uniref:Dephospho-CoA kinase n=1 Tax=Paenibacillus albiflavus TaxID=2545760 RepID=A0A4R4E820_9BACL|nr:dephospho-CoA kinase [Paenibacillus albiflavus]TCZ75287.1 dephospho-CoA kinase [Paenibacillus albiflavus]
MFLGLTGGIACGKSTVANMLKARGAILIDADVIAREVVEPGQPGLLQLVQHFGREIILPDGRLDRKALGGIVFGDEAKRKELNNILHPSIRKEIRNRMEKYAISDPDKLIVVDIPLLYESGYDSMFEQIMVVYVPREIQLKRLIHRDGFTQAEAEARLNTQVPIEDKKNLADVLIDNSGSLDTTEAQIEAFWKGI